MRQKSDYQIYPRKLKSGKTVYYYYAYDHRGKRISKSTGQTSLTAARNWVSRQLKAGRLVTSGAVRFGDWARDWWIWGKCPYIETRRGSIGQAHANMQRINLTKHILPYFQNMRLETITPGDIEAWISSLTKNGKSASLVNHCLRTLGTMLSEAERLQQIGYNPARTVRSIPEPKKQRKLLTLEEVAKLFDEKNYAKYWKKHILHYTINLLAASTGLRLGELLALRVEDCHENYVHPTGSWSAQYGLTGDSEQKRHERYVPIPDKTAAKLQELCSTMGSGWVFTSNNETPIAHRTVSTYYHATLERAGIDSKARGLSFHSWRHWFNTTMRSLGVADDKLRNVTGHQSAQMTDRYTSYRPEDFADVRLIQDRLF